MKAINWEDAINIRKSIRLYDGRPLAEADLLALKEFADKLEVPFEHQVKIRFFKADSARRLANNLKNPPPDNVAFIASTDTLSVTKAGFVGEMLILYATELGISTCWFGHYSLAELERVMPHLGQHGDLPMPTYGYSKGEVPGERAICITPLGYNSTEGLRLLDRMTGALMSYKRKPLHELVDGVSAESLPSELVYAMDLARKAPSAANSQFWRFDVAPNLKRVSISMPVGYKHIKWEHPDTDIGICACHFWLGLKIKEIPCRVSVNVEHGRAVWIFELQ